VKTGIRKNKLERFRFALAVMTTETVGLFIFFNLTSCLSSVNEEGTHPELTGS